MYLNRRRINLDTGGSTLENDSIQLRTPDNSVPTASAAKKMTARWLGVERGGGSGVGEVDGEVERDAGVRLVVARGVGGVGTGGGAPVLRRGSRSSGRRLRRDLRGKKVSKWCASMR